MKFSRDAWLGIGIISLLVLTTMFVALRQNNAPVIPYLSSSSAPSGTLGLKMWMNELGYASREISPTAFVLPADAKIIFIIEPLMSVTATEWTILDQWVEAGGLLIIAGDNNATDALLSHYELGLMYLGVRAKELDIATPLLNSPTLVSAPFKTSVGLFNQRDDIVTLLAINHTPVIASFEKERGRVIVSSTPYPFSNIALKENQLNGALILNLAALAVKPGPVWFDDWHHGIQKESVVGPEQWLRETPGGRSVVFIVATVFFALILRGRAFGRYVPLPGEIRRRGPLEHVTAIANLNRKARHRREVLSQYHQRVKRQLGKRYRLDSSLPDDEYVRILALHNPSIDKNGLSELLKKLSKKKITEAELVKLATEASEWMKD